MKNRVETYDVKIGEERTSQELNSNESGALFCNKIEIEVPTVSRSPKVRNPTTEHYSVMRSAVVDHHPNAARIHHPSKNRAALYSW